ncbi:MAG: type II secretion system F family protein [Sulfurospirillum sp.]|nr:type II secretion system F family protein [Sulfurospirillum sp.]MBL0703092.1 type II secretion system F family protein [Sulfurospirillum sp.]
MKYFEVHSLFKGKKNIQIVKAQNKNSAIEVVKLKNLGTIVNIQEISTPLKDQLETIKNNIMIIINKRNIEIKNLIAAIRQLAVMTDAGISIHDCIKEVSKATADKTLKKIFQQIDDDLNSGLSLTKSMMNFKHEFGDVTIAMVELGESTGSMAESLEKLAEILEEMEENRKKLKKALRYPITVIVAIGVAFAILMIYVVPKFKDIFSKLKTELPVPTKILLFMEHMVNTYGYILLIILISIIATSKYLLKNNKKFKAKYDQYILKVYLIGNIIFYATLSRFTLVFTELIRAGIPISSALDTALLTLDNIHLKKKLTTVKTSMSRGISLTEAFKDTGLFEGMLIQIIHAGEQSGTLDKMLDKVTSYLKSRFDEIIDNIATYIEPILLSFIAGMVLLMALGIFMPMWDMSQAVKH